MHQHRCGREPAPTPKRPCCLAAEGGMARAQSPCKPHSRTSQLHRQCNRNRIREQGSEGAADGAPVSPFAPVSPLSPLAPAAPVSPLSPFGPVAPAAPARAHTSAMRWAALRGRCHDRLRTDPNCPSYPKAAAQPHDRRQRAECPRQTDAAQTQKAYSQQTVPAPQATQRMSAQRRYLVGLVRRQHPFDH